MVNLTPYQTAWLTDDSRLKCFVKARRIGGTFIVGLDDALAAAGFEFKSPTELTYSPDRGVSQFIVGSSLRQSKILLAECLRHLEALSYIAGDQLVAVPGLERIVLKNGRTLEALPANPDTIRGITGDVTLEEAQGLPWDGEIWAAASIATNPTLGNRKGYKLRVNGTAFGDDNLFYKIAKTDFGNQFSRHFVDIYRAIREGFPADLDALRALCATEEEFLQEYCLQFFSAASRYISAEQYDSCLFSDEREIPNFGTRTGFAGMDVGRKSDGDPSVIQKLIRIGDTNWQDQRSEARKGSGWDDQEAWVAEVLGTCQRIAIDTTGMGNQFGERLINRFGSRIDPVEFTVKSKEMLATGLKLAMERRKLRLRADDAELRRDVLSLRRNITSHGNVTYEAARTKDGHADRAWALALAVHTAGSAPAAFQAFEPVKPRTSSQLKNW